MRRKNIRECKSEVVNTSAPQRWSSSSRQLEDQCVCVCDREFKDKSVSVCWSQTKGFCVQQIINITIILIFFFFKLKKKLMLQTHLIMHFSTTFWNMYVAQYLTIHTLSAQTEVHDVCRLHCQYLTLDKCFLFMSQHENTTVSILSHVNDNDLWSECQVICCEWDQCHLWENENASCCC